MKQPNQVKGYPVDKSTLINLERGKIPPQALDLEEVVLGAMMIDKKGVDEVVDILSPDAFYKEGHQHIFEAIFQLFENSEPIDLLTVSSQLKKNQKLDVSGGDFYLISLTQKVSSSAHIEFHARIILQKFIQRSLIKISSEIIEDAYDETQDVFDLLDKAESKLYEVTQGNIKKSSETAQDLVIQAKKKIEEISNQEGVPVAFFSLEMASVQLITRLISSETGLSSEKLRTGKLEKHEWEQLNVKVKGLEKAPLFIDDTPSLSIFDLRAKARRLASQHGIKMIMIDYLQLMTGGPSHGGNREQEISMISRNLKALAKELSVPVIALSQLSRAVETRGGSKRPLLSDLRESGAIEQDADIVSFIYRPEYYKIDEWDDEERSPTEGQAEFIIAKHRNGGLENIRLKFIGNLGKFDNLDDFDSPFEFHSKMNAAANDDTFISENLPSPSDAFGAPDDFDDNDVPF